jgi:hypothetical protein
VKPDPLTVECPQCGAKVGERCWSGTRRGRRLTRGSHEPRERVARGEKVEESFERWFWRELGEAVERRRAK